MSQRNKYQYCHWRVNNCCTLVKRGHYASGYCLRTCKNCLTEVEWIEFKEKYFNHKKANV